MPLEDTQFSRRAVLVASAATGLAATAGAAARTDTDGIVGTVPHGKTTVWQLGKQKSFETLTRVERPIPAPAPGQALIRVHYAGIASRDQGIATQTYAAASGPRPATRIPLSEGSGEVVAVGAGETRIKPGDRVTACHWPNWVSGPWIRANNVDDIGNTVDGWLGEFILLPAQSLVRLPAGMSWEDGAAVASSGVTIWNALNEVARVRADDVVLTLGTGGVSSFGVLLAKAAGARVVVTSSSDDKLARMRKLGADVTVNYRTSPQWGKEVVEKTGGIGATVVLENVGPATLDQSMAACANNARIVMIGAGRPVTDPPNLYGMYAKNLMLKAVTVGSRNMLESLLLAMAHNHIRPVISQVVPYAEAVQAYQQIRDGDHIGKIVIKVL